MDAEQLERVIEMWSDQILKGPLEDFKVEIEPDVKKEFAAIALYMDSKTVRASGEVEEFYEGYRKAATDILSFIGVEICEDPNTKTVKVTKSENHFEVQQKLMDHIWG
ncbi:MAG: hypothetical protein ACRENO_06970 [Thermodesulfobacteriota bacterium]